MHSDPPICGLTLSWAEKCARARRSARERTQAGQWVRGAARARAERSRRRWLPAHRQAGPSYLAQRKAGHLLRKFVIVCFEPLERTQPSVGRPNSKGSKRYQFVNLYLQVPSSKNRAHRQGNFQYFKGGWTFRYEVPCPRAVAWRKLRCEWNFTTSQRLRGSSRGREESWRIVKKLWSSSDPSLD